MRVAVLCREKEGAEVCCLLTHTHTTQVYQDTQCDDERIPRRAEGTSPSPLLLLLMLLLLTPLETLETLVNPAAAGIWRRVHVQVKEAAILKKKAGRERLKLLMQEAGVKAPPGKFLIVVPPKKAK